MNKEISLDSIPNSPRYVYTVEFIFPNPYQSASAFVKRNDNTGFHIQEFYEICIISRGEGGHAIEDSLVRAKKGDVFIVPPGRRHALIGGEGFDVHYIHLHPDFIKSYSSRMRELPSFLTLFEIEPLMRASGATYRHLYLDDEALSETVKIVESLSKMWQHDPASKLIVESYILVALTIFCREYEKLQRIIGKNASNDKLFMDSISSVIDGFGSKLTIDQLAHSAGMSRTSYIKRFREVTGKSPKAFITERRISAAKSLLISSGKTISKIAEETGFFDASHFSKSFIEATGLSPSEYRRGKR